MAKKSVAKKPPAKGRGGGKGKAPAAASQPAPQPQQQAPSPVMNQPAPFPTFTPPAGQQLGQQPQPFIPPARDLLGEAVAALDSGSAMMAAPEEMAFLTHDPRGALVESNAAMTDGTGRIAFRATALGKSLWQPPAPTPQPMWGSPQPQPFPMPEPQPSPQPEYQQPEPQPQPYSAPQNFPGPSTPGPQINAPAAPAGNPGAAVGLPGLTGRSGIVAGIPIPPVRRRTANGVILPFESLQVGQSFFIPATADVPEPSRKLASTVATASKRFGVKFVVRAYDDGAPWGPQYAGIKGAAIHRAE